MKLAKYEDTKFTNNTKYQVLNISFSIRNVKKTKKIEED